MSLAPYVRILGRGPGRSRSLAREEAAEAMRLILSGAAEPEAVGALLMLMRYRGETADEVAGMVEAARETLGPWPQAALDWPSYAAGRSRGLPWFLLSARLLAQAGHSVLLHGWTANAGTHADPRGALATLYIPLAETPDAARAAVARGGIAFVPLEALSPGLFEMLRLRDVLGLRSAINTVLRMLNPGGAAASVQGVFHPSYRQLQRDAACLLGQPRMTVLKGGGGEFERHPAKAVTLFHVAGGATAENLAPPLIDETRRLAEPTPDPNALAALWRGAHHDPFAEAVVTSTAAAALLTTGATATLAEAEACALSLWLSRNRQLAA